MYIHIRNVCKHVFILCVTILQIILNKRKIHFNGIFEFPVIFPPLAIHSSADAFDLLHFDPVAISPANRKD